MRDERLPKGPQFASESLDADTGSGTDLKLYHYRESRCLAIKAQRIEQALRMPETTAQTKQTKLHRKRPAVVRIARLLED